jgi:phosphoenolpyruvate synthase/pyruvate phosphate dikinase
MITKRLFSLAEANRLELVGGKGYALGEMIRAGFNVPEGFVLSVSSFKKMRPSLKTQLLSRFDELQVEFVAVRSSAIKEDGAEVTWAGQLETYLNRNRDNLLQSIEECWKSANSIRAQSYAAQKGISSTKVAVIVQEMIQSEVSGVAFSVHPISNNNAQVVIEAGFGLGEAVVSGQVTPDTYIVDKKAGRIVEKYISHQKRKLIRNSTGETVWEDISSHGDEQKLTNEQVEKLRRLTVELEVFFRFPVDVEWAISKGKIYILQSRPITTIERK